MKNRIIKKFNELKTENRGGFIPFIVAGDPDLATTKKLLLELARQDASVIELGIPFSDPVGDGVTNQASAERALKNNFGVADVLDLMAEIRKEGYSETPIILFSYFNPILQFGLENFARTAKVKGADGILIIDLIPEEAGEFHEVLTANELCLIMLAAPTSSDERLKKICDKASGFVYAVSRAGVTGARNEMSSEAENLVERLRGFTDLPIAVGFGISTFEQMQKTLEYADAAVIGSAIVAEIYRLRDSDDLIGEFGKFIERLRGL